MRQPIVPKPNHRGPSRGHSRAQTVFAAVVMLATIALLLALGTWAVRSLSDLPAGTATETIAADIEAARIRVETRTAQESVAPLPPAAVTPVPPGTVADGVQAGGGTDGDIRYVEGAGIVATRVDGPLSRAPSTVVVPEPVPEGPKPTLFNLVIIEDADTVNLRSHTVQLAHVIGPEASETCTTAAGAQWPCGMRARTALRRLVRRRALECLNLSDSPAPEGSPRPATCSAGGTDLSTWLVEQGWARPTDDAPDAMKSLHATAEREGRGLYDPAGR